MSTKPIKLSDQVRRAVDECGMGHGAVARAIGVSPATMSRFMNGKRGLSETTLDALADVLSLRVVADVPATKKTKRRTVRRKDGEA